MVHLSVVPADESTNPPTSMAIATTSSASRKASPRQVGSPLVACETQGALRVALPFGKPEVAKLLGIPPSLLVGGAHTPQCPADCECEFLQRGDVANPRGLVDAFVIDTVAKRHQDTKWIDFTRPGFHQDPSAPRVVLWNAENWNGRQEEWAAKYKKMWLNRTADPKFWDMFHLTASFERTADVHVPFTPLLKALDAELTPLRHEVPSFWQEAVADADTMFVASNCYTRYPDSIVGKFTHPDVPTLAPTSGRMPQHRSGLIRALKAHGLTVAGFGTCVNNRKKMDVFDCGRWGKMTKHCLMRRFPFYLAFENSVYPDYVTEKVYEALAAGTIPVYIGAPNVAMFLPTSNTVIDATHFSSAEELVGYLKCVARNETVAQQYLAWRERPTFSHWDALSQTNSLCKLCNALTKQIRGSGDRPHARPIPMPSETIDDPAIRDSQKPIPCT